MVFRLESPFSGLEKTGSNFCAKCARSKLDEQNWYGRLRHVKLPLFALGQAHSHHKWVQFAPDCLLTHRQEYAIYWKAQIWGKRTRFFNRWPTYGPPAKRWMWRVVRGVRRSIELRCDRHLPHKRGRTLDMPAAIQNRIHLGWWYQIFEGPKSSHRLGLVPWQQNTHLLAQQFGASRHQICQP